MTRAWVRPGRQQSPAAASQPPGMCWAALPKFPGMIMSSASPPHPNVSGQQSGRRRHPAVMRMRHQMVTPGGQTPMTET
jgi:hypothetical protein